MNQKKAKMLRNAVKDLGINPRETSYKHGLPPQYGRFTVGEDGKYVPSEQGHIVLKLAKGKPTVLNECGRKAYKNLKKAA